MTDYHCHILPGVDDGSSSLDESIQMARLLVEAGFNSVHCTPHLIKNLYDASNATVLRSIRELQTALNRKGIALKLLAGREYCMDNHFHEYLDDLLPLEGTRYLLIEIPSGSYQGMILETVTAIRHKGYIPMIAHPERCRLFDEHKNHKTPKLLGFFKRNTIRGRMELEYSYQQFGLLDWLSGIECGFQGNAGSFAGMAGRSAQEAAKRFWQHKIYTHYGTDAHTPEFLEKLVRQIRDKKQRSFSWRANTHNADRIELALS